MVFPIVYLAAPAVILVLASAVNMVPLSGPGNLFGRLSTLDLLVLASYPLSALAIFSVRKAGWWVFICASLWLVANNVGALALNPLVSPLATLAFNLALIGAAGFFFRRHVIAPYFNPRLRPWECPPRYRLDVSSSLSLDGSETPLRVVDLSRGGAFVVPLARPAPRVGLHAELSIRVDGTAYRVPVAVVRRQALAEGGTGYGLMFTGGRGIDALADAMEATLRGLPIAPASEFSEQRAHRRFSLMPSLAIELSDRTFAASLEDLSSGGLAARLQAAAQPHGSDRGGFAPLPAPEGLASGTALVATLRGRRALRLPATVAWSHAEGSGLRIGLRFERLDSEARSILRRYLRLLRRLGATERLPDPTAMEALIAETLEHCPYRLVARLRGFFGHEAAR